MPHSKPAALKQFIERTQKKWSTTKTLLTNLTDWEKLYGTLHETHPTQRATEHRILAALSTQLNFTHNQLIKHLSHSYPERTTRNPLKIREHHDSHFHLHFFNSTTNRLVVNENTLNLNAVPQNELTHSGTRVCPIYTDTKGILRTPTKGTAVRPFIEKNGTQLLAEITPNKPPLTLLGPNEIRKKLPKMHYNAPGPTSYIATQSKMIEAQDKRRRISQHQLTGEACRNVFIAYNEISASTSHGRQYHWSHLVAHFLGGEQTASNLVPGTAESNYNTLEVVETHIRDLLLKERTNTVEMTVTPHYLNGCIIPEHLKFELSWKEKQSDTELITQLEKIVINTQSHRRITTAEHETIEFFRKIPKTNQAQKSNSLFSTETPKDSATEAEENLDLGCEPF